LSIAVTKLQRGQLRIDGFFYILNIEFLSFIIES
jgi:hypothetical protein